MHSLTTVLAVIAAAAEYWEANEVELFLFGATTDAIEDAALFADEVKPVEWLAELRLAA